MGLEIATGKTPGEEIRRTEAPRPPLVGLMILAMTFIIFLFGGLTYVVMCPDYLCLEPARLDAGEHDPAIPNLIVDLYFQELTFFLNEQTIVSFWLACMFFGASWVILLYQRYYVDHVTIAKKRFRKWEDEGVQLHE